MPKKDIYHDAVKNALIKDGWKITADPYKIKYKDAQLFADLALEKPILAEQNERKIIVEIKSFLSPSPMRDFEIALGQYILYKNIITLTAPEYKVYLAIKDDVYENFFKRESIRDITQINKLLLVVVDMEREEILQWID
ncbi:XisH family protein [Cyanobacterium stanieri LEGE 03274]|uniref:XisH family protein n=1 Tax=Cyanobacterium stanieri LEGE 03274 TaxID=1828756 RepID=A0ABR9V6D0_9CHRO|nr:XisH family protein [Cyanobacterium stanieri]MBE9223089.1 XisH family protein [Cyanobacterium stanieri LEGE 03274]